MTFLPMDKDIGRPHRIVLIPSDYTWLDPKTLLVHQGAVLIRPEGDRGRVIGYSKLCTDVLCTDVLCTDVLSVEWKDKPMGVALVVSCFDCLGATEQ